MGAANSDAVPDGATQVAETDSQDLKAQHEVACAAIASIWRQSQAEKRDYFGFIYRDRDGNYHATPAVPGLFMTVPQQTAEAVLQEILEGATVTASYHTHFNSPLATLREKENFSTRDIVTSRDHRWDAYMGTGISGHLLYYSFDENAVSDLGRLYPTQ